MFRVEQHRDAGENPSQPDFEQVFLPHLDAAYNLARWLLRNDHDAEDAVQEAYVRAYKAFARFRGGDGKAWFMTILRNVCYTMIKKSRSHETPEPFDEEIHQPVGESVQPMTTCTTSCRRESRIVDRTQNRRQISGSLPISTILIWYTGAV